MSVNIVAGRLDAALDTIKHASADNEARPILASIAFVGDEQGFRIVAADNFRLAIAELEVLEDSDPASFGTAVVPRDALAGIRWLLGTAKRSKRVPVPVQIERPDDTPFVTFRVWDSELRVRLVDGNYPKWGDVLASATSKVTGRVDVRPSFLGDVGKALRGSARVAVEFGGPLDPVVITAGDDAERYTEIVMPIWTVTSVPKAPPTEAVA
jgi:DNA polymerase III sliding clamp (beta) subunit (PCNA family)